jgi:hypothetical protein
MCSPFQLTDIWKCSTMLTDMYYSLTIVSRALVTTNGVWIGFIDTLFTKLGTTGNTALSLVYTLYNSQLHTHEDYQSSLVVSLQRSQCNFKSHMESSLHSLIPILLLFCNCQINSIPLLPSSYPGRLASRNSTLFFSTELLFITTLHGPNRKHSLSLLLGRRIFSAVAQQWKLFYCSLHIFCRWNVFTESLPSNGLYVNRNLFSSTLSRYIFDPFLCNSSAEADHYLSYILFNSNNIWLTIKTLYRSICQIIILENLTRTFVSSIFTSCLAIIYIKFKKNLSSLRLFLVLWINSCDVSLPARRPILSLCLSLGYIFHTSEFTLVSITGPISQN